MKKILIGLLLMMTFTGCSQNKTFFKCVNEKMNLNNELGYKNFSYLDSIRKIELSFIKSKLLKDNTKDSYILLVNKLTDNTVNFKEEFEILKGESVFFEHVNSTSTMFLNLTSECASHKPNFNQVFDSMKINGYPSYEDLIDLTKVMKFNNVEDRLLLCNFIFLHFKSLYDDDIKNEERYPEIKF